MTTETSTSLITTALYRLGVVAIEQPVDDSYIQRGLVALNDVIDEWGGSSVYIPCQTLITLPLTATVESYTVGPSASYTLNENQVMDLLEIVINDPQSAGVSYPVYSITEQMYRNIPYKLGQGIPQTVLFRNFPNYSEFHFQPIPYSTLTASMLVKQRIAQFSLNQAMTIIPNHYLVALKLNLQNLLAQEFGKTLDENFMRKLKDANDNVLASNFGVDWSTKKDEILHNGNAVTYPYWWTS